MFNTRLFDIVLYSFKDELGVIRSLPLIKALWWSLALLGLH